MAAGLAPTRLRPADACSSSSRRLRAGKARSAWSHTLPCRIRRRAPRSRRSAAFKIETQTTVALGERLVSFTPLKLTEANFPTLDRDQTREVVDEITDGIPDHERVIALDRVLADVDKSQIIPKNVEGVKADPPTDLLQHDARRAREPRRRSDLEPDQGQRPEVRRQHELGSVPARADARRYYLRTTTVVAEGRGRRRAVDAGRAQLPDSFSKLPADDNWKDVKAALPGQEARRRSTCRPCSSARRRRS